MKILVLGCGLMGPGAAFKAMGEEDVEEVILADRDEELLAGPFEKLRRHPGGEKLRALVLDATDSAAAARGVAQADVVISALPLAISAPAIRAAVAAGRSLVDLTRPVEGEMALLEEAVRRAGITVVPGCGVDPGLTEVLARHLAAGFDRVEELHIRCGGIPESPAPPLGYRIVFGGRELPLREEEALAVEGGQVRSVPRYSGAESVLFPGVGVLEAYHEGFLPGFLRLPEWRELRAGSLKTVRWPGFAAKAALLRELGLLSRKPLAVDGAEVAPKKLLDALLASNLRLGEEEKDVVVIRVQVSGLRNERPARLRAEAVVRRDLEAGFTAMARATAFPAAAVALMIGRGELRSSGLLAPEEVLTGSLFHRLMASLAAAGIRFELAIETSEELL